MVEFVCRIPAGQVATVKTWLKNNGVDVNRDENGIELTVAERMIGDICTPIWRDADNTIWFVMRIKKRLSEKIPDKPNYIPWRSDQNTEDEKPTWQEVITDENGQPLQRAEYDDQGNVTGWVNQYRTKKLPMVY